MKALLEGSKIFLDFLLLPLEESLLAKLLPPILILQLDNVSRDNKNHWGFAFYSLLVYKDIFCEVYINFFIVRYTYEDIDVLFGQWSSKLKTNNYLTLLRLMKSFMDCEMHPIILHLIEEVPDFKAFVDGYLDTCGDFLGGHSKSQQFKFSMDYTKWLLMEYKNMCIDKNWLLEYKKGIRFWSQIEDRCSMVLNEDLLPLVPHQMKSHKEVKKGLMGFIAQWNQMANDDNLGEFRRKNGLVKDYWEGVRVALDALLQVCETLLDGF